MEKSNSNNTNNTPKKTIITEIKKPLPVPKSIKMKGIDNAIVTKKSPQKRIGALYMQNTSKKPVSKPNPEPKSPPKTLTEDAKPNNVKNR